MTRLITLALALLVSGCQSYSLADHERDGYIRSFNNNPPPQIVWHFDLPAGANSFAARQGGVWHLRFPPECHPDVKGSWSVDDTRIACDRAMVAHVTAVNRVERGESRCVVELRKHADQGLTPDLAALGCDHTGREI